MINNVQTEKIEQLDKLIWNQEKDKAIGRNQLQLSLQWASK